MSADARRQLAAGPQAIRLPSTSRRRCRCGCGQRATHTITVNGTALGPSGCELYVRREARR